jgi:hypothetical protein
MRCDSCGSELSDLALACPSCRAPCGAFGLALDRGGAQLDRALTDGLARSLAQALLARAEPTDELMRSLDVAGPLAPAELGAAVRQLADSNPSLAELEGLITQDVTRLNVEGLELSRLLDRRADLPLLRKGMALLKHRRYEEAAEWWALHREQLDPTERRLDLLLLIMEVFTHTLAGHQARASALRKQLREHPVYLEHRGRDRK